MSRAFPVVVLSLAAVCGCSSNSTPPECAAQPESDIEVKSAGIGVSGLWLSPTEGCCSCMPQSGTLVADGNILLQDVSTAPGDYTVTPCVASESMYPASCGGGTVGARYYHPGGQAGGTGTIHIDSSSPLSGSADIVFSEAGQTWHFKGTFTAPVCQVE